VPVLLQEGSRLLHNPMFLAAFFTFVTEYPRFDTIRDFSLSLLVNRDAVAAKTRKS